MDNLNSISQMMNFKNTTFVITTYKSEKIIYKCLKLLPKKVKKIVIENSQNFLLKKKLEKNFCNIKCYVMKKNLGYGTANNFGIKKAKTNYICILNPDARFTKKNFIDASKILKGKNFSIAAPIPKRHYKKYNRKKKYFEVNQVKGFMMILNMKNMKNILFDENFFLYLEEIDLCKRVRKINGKIYLINIPLLHYGGMSHGNKNDIEMVKSRNWHWMWSRFYFFKKHYGYMYAAIKMFPSLFFSIINIIVYSLLFNKYKIIIYLMRFRGLANSYLLNKSYYRPYDNVSH